MVEKRLKNGAYVYMPERHESWQYALARASGLAWDEKHGNDNFTCKKCGYACKGKKMIVCAEVDINTMRFIAVSATCPNCGRKKQFPLAYFDDKK